MKYWIRIDGASDQAVTKEEMLSKYRGRLTAETPCARVGENSWGKLSDFFEDCQSAMVEKPGGPPSDAREPAAPTDRYPALSVIIGLYRLLAVFVGLAALVVVFVGIADLGAFGRNALGWWIILAGTCGGFFAVITNLAIAEAIRLLLDIERNTRETADRRSAHPNNDP